MVLERCSDPKAEFSRHIHDADHEEILYQSNSGASLETCSHRAVSRLRLAAAAVSGDRGKHSGHHAMENKT